MGRRKTYCPLAVFLNNRLLGSLIKEPSGAITFTYDPSWLSWKHAVPVSLSLPLRENRYIGAPVIAVFENLLPDSDSIRKHVAERVGAAGIDAYSLLSKIGRDCIGALQFLPMDQEIHHLDTPQGISITDLEIEDILRNLVKAPLGMSEQNNFRISIAGVQEKTALLFKEGQWFKPLGTTPTTHIFKTQIGHLPNGIDLSNSVENEFYCLKLMEEFGLPVNQAKIQTFGNTKALVIERFDRIWTKEGKLLRVPQEDCCQALSVPPTLKYQNQGGPGILDIMKLLKGSDEPMVDQGTFFKSQIIFWLIGATDGHGKNFSLFLNSGGRYRLTPLYDVLTAQPSIDARHLEIKELKLAMSVGDSRHYKMADILGRHFVQTGERSGLSKPIIYKIIEEIIEEAPQVLERLENKLPSDFSEDIHVSVRAAMIKRTSMLREFS
jgi:serine/threonine-protein kinase HipA